MTVSHPPAGPAIILVEPQLGENIGTAARAMANFGLQDLRLVAPRDGWPNEKARSAASGADGVIDAVRIFPSAEEAVADLNYVAATTARVRDMVKPVVTPQALAVEMRERLGAGQRAGILFGRERSGLTNDHVVLADAIVMAPVDPAFASLNLAQAVLLIGYEWRKSADAGTLGRETVFDGPGVAGMEYGATRPATKEELVGFFEHLERELVESGFLFPPEKRPAMVRSIRNMFQRLQATEQDIRTLRGIVASLSRAHKRKNAGE